MGRGEIGPLFEDLGEHCGGIAPIFLAAENERNDEGALGAVGFCHFKGLVHLGGGPVIALLFQELACGGEVLEELLWFFHFGGLFVADFGGGECGENFGVGPGGG